MTTLSDLRPTHKSHVMDLVREAGIDVSDWKNFKGGVKLAHVNPKYCYEWSFVQAGKVVVLNLWHAQLKQRDGTIAVDLNMRRTAHHHAERGQGVWKRRAQTMDYALRTAIADKLPIRVVILDGKMRRYDEPNPRASQVALRRLDPVPWAVTAYNPETGQSTLTRGAAPERLVDQFSLEGESATAAERRPVTGEAFVRDSDVRRRALERAGGHCEYCGKLGFKTPEGGVFLETHHVVPLGEGGADTLRNVAAICANHHREAHHGVNRVAIRQALLDKLQFRL